ncbi:hypothetical protein [Herbiconiux liangxiaofengii]|uniref:hypothetical protein n=1 Tax=Herbiconiux liangxiaofengii TaxID=3342795 RepID=UPI0035BA0C56
MASQSPAHFPSILRVALGTLLVLLGSAPISIASAPPTSAVRLDVVTAQPVSSESSCRTEADAADCDVDRDRIPDLVERMVCADLTCADGTEDTDSDGIADWVEVSVCDNSTCAHPDRDSDDDGIPDFAEILTCGDATCSNSRENRDGDAATDWAETVICGDPTCATGLEDYDSNGIADAAELQACVREVSGLALTGSTIAWAAILGALSLIGGGLLLRMRRARRARTLAIEDTVS